MIKLLGVQDLDSHLHQKQKETTIKLLVRSPRGETTGVDCLKIGDGAVFSARICSTVYSVLWIPE